MLAPRHVVEGVVGVAAGPRGYVVVVWLSGRERVGLEVASGPRVFASVRSPGARRFGTPRALSPAHAGGAELAMAPNGDTIVSWRDRAGIRAVFRSPAGSWSAPQTVAVPPEDGFPQLAVGSDGTAVMGWATRAGGDERTEAAVRLPGVGFGAPQTVLTGNFVYSAVAAARGGLGAIVRSGVCPLGAPAQPAQAVFLRPGGTFGPPTTIPNSKCPDAGLSLAMDDRGAAVLIVNGSPHGSGIKAASRPPGGSFGRAELISGRGRPAAAEVGISGDGRAVAVWDHQKNRDPCVSRMAATIRPPGGSFGVPRLIAGACDAPSVLAVNRRGHAVALGQSLRSRRLKAAYLRPGERFGGAERVSPPILHHDHPAPPPFEHEPIASPVVALSPSGRALAAWSRPMHGFERGVFVAERGPNCRGQRATIAGTRGDDTIVGTAGRDVIVARAGADRIRGRRGNDLICAGGGPDIAEGGRGDDRILGGSGRDAIWGGPGGEFVSGGRGRDNLAGGPGDDLLLGSLGADGLSGDGGVDRCRGGPPRVDVGGRRTADIADRASCESLQGARPVRIDFGPGPAVPAAP